MLLKIELGMQFLTPLLVEVRISLFLCKFRLVSLIESFTKSPLIVGIIGFVWVFRLLFKICKTPQI